MPIATVTVDTSVVIDAIDGTRPAAIALFQHAMLGRVNVAVSSRVRHELKSKATGPLAAFLERIPVLASPARYGVSLYGEEVYAEERYNPPASQAMDADHVEAHRLSGNQYFVTSDDGQRRRAERAGVAAFTAEAMIAKLTAERRAARSGRDAR